MKHQYMIRVLLFVAYQGTRIWTSDTTVVTIPTADMKRGIFGTTNIYDPVNVVNGARVQYDAGGALRCRRRQTHFVVSPKSKEELYDTEADPDEVHNLANDPKYQKMLTKMRGALNKWIKDTKDMGAISERELIKRGIVRDRLTEYEERKKPGYKSGWF